MTHLLNAQSNVRRSFKVMAIVEWSQGELRTYILTRFDVVGDGGRVVVGMRNSLVYHDLRSRSLVSLM